MKFAVIQFGGSNCDRDAEYVLSEICGVDTDLVWFKSRLDPSYDAVIIPGGFSYGDYLRAGAIAARTPVMADIVRHAEKGKLVLGICNGAQILDESGLIPGMFTINAYPKFICRPVHLRVETTDSPFTSLYRKGEVVGIPIAHKEGRYVAPEQICRDLERDDRITFRFCTPDGEVTPESNPNGSAGNITGILSGKRNVMAMMPHPERASEEILGSKDGEKIFLSMIRHIERNEAK
ncbi:phosphoribosylformylglycinamidine synthase [Methanolinea mesophila]|uniref:phosphoribosylformylglycinamidine synthase I n=1 Tax=Methanolinea mesophila TaxID=547055 RepID=UPI001AE31D1C|nr:phosphoribosylformylglycinamidine synthase I [Methanolinea mesophila]MBP1929448.1 phosphoribosylformylglycinamidine synthase [Methanolinea mesophila]